MVGLGHFEQVKLRGFVSVLVLLRTSGVYLCWRIEAYGGLHAGLSEKAGHSHRAVCIEQRPSVTLTEPSCDFLQALSCWGRSQF